MRSLFVGGLVMVAALAGSSWAQAEVKPKGAVVRKFCGDYSKSSRVCIADSRIPGKAVLIFEDLLRNHYPRFYFADKSDRTPKGLVGVQNVSYITSEFETPDLSVPWDMENSLELRTTRAVYPNSPLKARLYKNDKPVSFEFTMQKWLVTQ